MEADGWSEEIGRATDEYIYGGGGVSVLKVAANQMAKDISRVCDRVKTGRLKKSFKGKVESGRY